MMCILHQAEKGVHVQYSMCCLNVDAGKITIKGAVVLKCLVYDVLYL